MTFLMTINQMQRTLINILQITANEGAIFEGDILIDDDKDY